MKIRRIVPPLAFAMGILGVGLGLIPFSSFANAADDAMAAMQITTPKTRMAAPQFQLKDIEGKIVHLDDFKDKAILINFWATWCIPCKEEMPALQQLWEKYRTKGFVVIAVSADNDIDAVRQFRDKQGLTFPILLDTDNTVQNSYEVLAVPMTYLISNDGKLSGRVLGIRDWASPRAFKVIESLF